MSDEDRDVDVESDDDDDAEGSPSPSSTSGGINKHGGAQYHSQADKRAHHNALERKRRDHIKDSFSSLRDAVPCLQGEKGTDEHPRGRTLKGASRAQILKKAAEYIQFMRRRNTAHQQDIDDLKKQNKMLEDQIRSLEKAKNSGTFSASAILEQSTHINNKGDVISAFDGGSGSDTSDTEESGHSRRKKLKTSPPNTSPSGT